MSEVKLVGILNVTPDSFSDGGLYGPDKAGERVWELFQQGASIVDIGAESTRPDATPLSATEEWDRLKSFLPNLIHGWHGQISVDTYHPETVRELTRISGQFIVNDVTAFNNPEMIEAAAGLNLRCIVSHLPERVGQDIQAAHQQKSVTSIEQVTDELMQKHERMIAAGIYAGRIILDPGIGFGKTIDLNWQLLEFAKFVPDVKVMIGYSRKKFLGMNRMEIEPNLEAGKIAIAAGAKYLRVHDVAGHIPLTRR